MAVGGDIEIRYTSWYICQALAGVKEADEARRLLMQCYRDMCDYRSTMGPIPDKLQWLWEKLEAEFEAKESG